jgi:hypothetical protein
MVIKPEEVGEWIRDAVHSALYEESEALDFEIVVLSDKWPVVVKIVVTPREATEEGGEVQA